MRENDVQRRRDGLDQKEEATACELKEQKARRSSQTGRKVNGQHESLAHPGLDTMSRMVQVFIAIEQGDEDMIC